MSELQKIFKYEGNEVRTVVDETGTPWWVAADICQILGIAKHRDAMSRLSDKQRGSVVMDTLGGKQEMAAVNEAGLYKLAFTSRKAAAEKFTDWVASEVLPSIRKTGKYETAPALPQTFSEALRMLARLHVAPTPLVCPALIPTKGAPPRHFITETHAARTLNAPRHFSGNQNA